MQFGTFGWKLTGQIYMNRGTEGYRAWIRQSSCLMDVRLNNKYMLMAGYMFKFYVTIFNFPASRSLPLSSQAWATNTLPRQFVALQNAVSVIHCFVSIQLATTVLPQCELQYLVFKLYSFSDNLISKLCYYKLFLCHIFFLIVKLEIIDNDDDIVTISLTVCTNMHLTVPERDPWT